MNYNIQSLLRSLSNQQQPQGQPTGIDPNLALVMQAMGMMTKQLDTQGRPIIPGQTNPSLMDQHYARQQNPQAMADRYGAPMFSQGPARVQGPQMPITARQPVEGLPGQVGPAMSLNQTSINMSPTAQENADMQAARVWAQPQNAAKQSAPRQTPWRPTGPISVPNRMASLDRNFGVPTPPKGHYYGVTQNPKYSPQANAQFDQGLQKEKADYMRGIEAQYQQKIASIPQPDIAGFQNRMRSDNAANQLDANWFVPGPSGDALQQSESRFGAQGQTNPSLWLAQLMKQRAEEAQRIWAAQGVGKGSLRGTQNPNMTFR